MCLFVVLCIPNGYCIFTNTEDKQLLHNSNKKTKQWITFYLAICRAYARCNPLILSIINILCLLHVQLIELVLNRIGLIYNNVHVINHFGYVWNLQDLFLPAMLIILIQSQLLTLSSSLVASNTIHIDPGREILVLQQQGHHSSRMKRYNITNNCRATNM